MKLKICGAPLDERERMQRWTCLRPQVLPCQFQHHRRIKRPYMWVWVVFFFLGERRRSETGSTAVVNLQQESLVW